MEESSEFSGRGRYNSDKDRERILMKEIESSEVEENEFRR